MCVTACMCVPYEYHSTSLDLLPSMYNFIIDFMKNISFSFSIIIYMLSHVHTL